MAEINDRTLILVAGDYSVHSQAIKDLEKQIRRDNSIPAESIAVIYGKAIQRLKRREAEDLYLAPIGLNTDTFLAQQKEMSESFVQMIANQLQAFRGEDVEALIVGGSRDENSHIYLVNTRGMVSCCDDVGFAAIGSGAWHARSRLMQAGYTNSQRFAAALAMTYAAKKSADIAPGVGTNTDIKIVYRDAVIDLWPYVYTKLHEIYVGYVSDTRAVAEQAITDLHTFITTPASTEGSVNAESQRKTAGDSAANALPPLPATEAARDDETGAGTKPD